MGNHYLHAGIFVANMCKKLKYGKYFAAGYETTKVLPLKCFVIQLQQLPYSYIRRGKLWQIWQIKFAKVLFDNYLLFSSFDIINQHIQICQPFLPNVSIDIRQCFHPPQFPSTRYYSQLMICSNIQSCDHARVNLRQQQPVHCILFQGHYTNLCNH